MKWTKPKILRELKRLHKSDADLSYNALAKRKQALLSAAAYHFSSYKHALERAGIEYSQHVRRPRWTRAKIIAAIRHARREREDLNWTAVTKRRDDLGKAAFASLQRRLFGSWSRALRAAGLHSDNISAYRAWNRDRIVHELKERNRDGEPLNSGSVQRQAPALHAAAFRHFGQYDRALRAAGIRPERVRLRRRGS